VLRRNRSPIEPDFPPEESLEIVPVAVAVPEPLLGSDHDQSPIRKSEPLLPLPPPPMPLLPSPLHATRMHDIANAANL